jgi:reverse gyrase
MNLNNVAALKNPTIYDYRVGQFMVTDGAWNRKYEIVAVVPVKVIEAYISWGRRYANIRAADIASARAVTVENRGSYFADGSVRPARRVVRDTFTVYELVDGRVIAPQCRKVIVRPLNTRVNERREAARERQENEYKRLSGYAFDRLQKSRNQAQDWFTVAVANARCKREEQIKQAEALAQAELTYLRKRYNIK